MRLLAGFGALFSVGGNEATKQKTNIMKNLIVTIALIVLTLGNTFAAEREPTKRIQRQMDAIRVMVTLPAEEVHDFAEQNNINIMLTNNINTPNIDLEIKGMWFLVLDENKEMHFEHREWGAENDGEFELIVTTVIEF